MAKKVENTNKISKLAVVIPFDTMDDKVKLAVAGWRKFFHENFTIVGIGKATVEAKKLFDTVLASRDGIQSVAHAISELGAKECIFTTPNIFPVNEFDCTEVKIVKKEPDDSFVRNLPLHFDINTLLCISAAEDYDVITMYMNAVYGKRVPTYMNLDSDSFRCLITRPDANWSRLPYMLERKVWVTISDAAFQPQLISALTERLK